MAKNREGSSHRSLQHLSDHFDGERFHNLTHTSLKSLTQVIQWKLKGGAKKWPAWRDNDAKPDVALPLQDGLVRVTCINHLTYLIQTSKLTILTDPLFSQRASPFRAIGPKRVRAPGVALSELPWVDVVLVSHNHYDHMDIDSLNDLERRFHPQFVMPLGNRHYVSELASERVHELDW